MVKILDIGAINGLQNTHHGLRAFFILSGDITSSKLFRLLKTVRVN